MEVSGLSDSRLVSSQNLKRNAEGLSKIRSKGPTSNSSNMNISSALLPALSAFSGGSNNGIVCNEGISMTA